MADDIFECRDVSKQFGGVNAVEKVSLRVPEGSVCALIGPNGAGKTTLFNVATNIYQPSSGEIRFFGKDVIGMSSRELAAAGVVRTFQTARVFPGMTTLENVLSGAYLGTKSSIIAQMFRSPGALREERENRRRAIGLLEVAGLTDVADRLCSDLSLGAQKLAEILRAIMAQPRLLLLDEPAAGLNDSETAEMSLMLRGLQSAGVTILLVEHNMSLVMDVAESIFVLDAGRLIAEGNPEAIRTNRRVIEAYLGKSAEAA